MAAIVLLAIAREIQVAEIKEEINLLSDTGFSSVRSSNEPLKDDCTQTLQCFFLVSVHF